MKLKRKNRTFFRGSVFAMAFALTVLCFPVDALTASAIEDLNSVDYNHLTIGTNAENGDVNTVVTKGSTYFIPFAYVGGVEANKVGRDIAALNSGTRDAATVTSSTVEVLYSSKALDEITSDDEVEDATDKVLKYTSSDEKYADYYGQFTAEKEGTYTIRYTYTYKLSDGSEYTNSYDLKVVSSLPSANFNFKDNDSAFIPSVVDLKWAKDGESYKDLYLPNPTITREGVDEDIPAANYVKKLPANKEGKYVVVSARGGVNGGSVELGGEAGALYISGDTFKAENSGAYKYTIQYSYYEDGNFVTSTTKETQVYLESNPYYDKYDLKFELTPSWDRNAGQTGVQVNLPKATGITTNSKGENQAVDVRYSVKVLYRADSTKTWAELDEEVYNSDAKNPILESDGEEGYFLKDPTVFKPLQDGTYSFIYRIYDYYGSKGEDGKVGVVSRTGVYTFDNIKDETPPTPVLFDASVVKEVEGEGGQKVKVPTYEDASHKLKTRAVPNSVVVYAIGIEDNVSTNDDEDIKLIRRVRVGSTSKFDIDNQAYNKYNLVFNYRNTSESGNAWRNLLTNNFLIRKEAEKTVTDDATMKNWLIGNNYLLVIDNANAEHIYGIYSADLKTLDESIIDASSFKAYLTKARNEEELKAFTNALIGKGFAYINVGQTFGAASSGSTEFDRNIAGMGTNQYYIDYIATDAAKNETTSTKSIYVGTYSDSEAPEITFSSTLKGTYLPEETVTFNAPSATDKGTSPDTTMRVETLYRFLNAEGAIVDLKDKDGELISTENLSSLWEDLTSNEDNSIATGLAEKYKAFHTDGVENEGYVVLTNPNATTYSIDLKTAKDKNVTELQIVSYVYDDMGNVTMYAESVNVASVIDNFAPKMVPTNEVGNTDYVQGQEIVLPTIQVMDDKVSYVSYDVTVEHVENDKRTTISVYDTKSNREIQGADGLGTLTINPGKFVAGFAGTYQATITAKDANNKTVVYFVTYNVEGRNVVQSPRINATFKDVEIELDGDDNYDATKGLEIPAPKVSYQIDNSITYDEFKKLSTVDAKTPQYVIKGVSANGNPDEWYTSVTGKDQTFVATKTGEFKVIYTVGMTVYDRTKFEFRELALNDGNYGDPNAVGFYAVGGSTKIEFNENGEYLIDDYRVFEKDGEYWAEKDGTTVKASSAITSIDMDTLFKGLINYNLKSDAYTITVKDTKGPKLSSVYDDPTTYPAHLELKDVEDGYKLDILGIQAEDKSGIDYKKSSITLRWNLADNGQSGSTSWTKEENLINGASYTINSTGHSLDGTYTITYHVEDKLGNATEKVVTITVGDTVGPEIEVKDSAIAQSYEIGSELIIKFSDITLTDTVGDNLEEGAKPTITLRNTTASKDVEGKVVGDTIVFNLDEVGSYTLTVKASDKPGNTTTKTMNFDVTAKSQDATMTYKVVGTVLIVVSVIVLAGVIIYFIVSKVKLDKELKKK